MFYGCQSLENISGLVLKNVDTLNQFFYDCQSLLSVPEIVTDNV